MRAPGPAQGLGLDVGGTQARWALAAPDGSLRAEGQVEGFTGAQVHDGTGKRLVRERLRALGQAVAPHLGAEPVRVLGGCTGHDSASGPTLPRMLARSLGCPQQAVSLHSDVELLARLCFAPGEGIVVIAGTGSIAVHVDAAGTLHRVGGRGGLLGDEGSGFGIARAALAAVWRLEDEQPGSLEHSVLARELAREIGGAGWDATRRFLHSASRGEFGRLALAVARAAEADEQAATLLDEAGRELARLATLLARRHGVHPLVVAGRVPRLHPRLERALRSALPEGMACQVRAVAVHREAAQVAAWGRLPASQAAGDEPT